MREGRIYRAAYGYSHWNLAPNSEALLETTSPRPPQRCRRPFPYAAGSRAYAPAQHLDGTHFVIPGLLLG